MVRLQFTYMTWIKGAPFYLKIKTGLPFSFKKNLSRFLCTINRKMPSYTYKMANFLFWVISRNLTTREFKKRIFLVNPTKSGFLLVTLLISQSLSRDNRARRRRWEKNLHWFRALILNQNCLADISKLRCLMTSSRVFFVFQYLAWTSTKILVLPCYSTRVKSLNRSIFAKSQPPS